MNHPNDIRMTFAEHLEELRARILLSLGAFALVLVVALIFQRDLFAFFIRPYRQAVTSIADRSPPADSYQQRLLSAWLEQLEGKGYITAEDREAVAAQVGPPPGHANVSLSSVDVTETFMAHIKLCLLVAAVGAAPVLLFQMWQFIGAGLYEHERRVIRRVLPLSLAMFGAGLAFGFFLLVPVSLDFLLSYGDPELVQQTTRVSSYLGLLFILLLVMGAVFQVPLVMTVLASIGAISPRTFRTKRKFFVLGAVVTAALLTPPDYVTQLLVAAPMVVLYEVGVICAGIAARRRQRRLAMAQQANS